jgi:hypothetical protein
MRKAYLDDLDTAVMELRGADATAAMDQVSMRTRQPETATWLGQATEYLQSLRSLNENWDGYGAAAPDPTILQSSVGFLGFVATHSTASAPHISPARTGGVVFEWESQPHELEVEIIRDGAAEYLYLDNRTGTEVSGCLFFDDADDGRFLRLLGEFFCR